MPTPKLKFRSYRYFQLNDVRNSWVKWSVSCRARLTNKAGSVQSVSVPPFIVQYLNFGIPTFELSGVIKSTMTEDFEDPLIDTKQYRR